MPIETALIRPEIMSADSSTQYAFRDVNIIDSLIVITCADAVEAERAKVDAMVNSAEAIAFGIRASTLGDQGGGVTAVAVAVASHRIKKTLSAHLTLRK